MITPIHEWQVGRGKARSSIVLTAPDSIVLDSVGRPGVALLFLTELWVPPHARRRGYATTLLEAVTAWADEESVDLWLYCSPHGPGGRLTTEQLAKLYKAHWFTQINPESPDYEMVRRCRARPS